MYVVINDNNKGEKAEFPHFQFHICNVNEMSYFTSANVYTYYKQNFHAITTSLVFYAIHL